MKEYLNYWKNYANFNDRTSRKGFWMVVLFNIIISFLFYTIVIVSVGGFAEFNHNMTDSTQANSMRMLVTTSIGLWGLANLIPNLAIAVRRLHDTGRSWLNLLFGLIPVIGVIVLLVFYLSGTNLASYNNYLMRQQV